MKLSSNLIAGLVNSAWSALVGLIVIPVYLKYLGLEVYGLIGFFVTLQSVLMLLDMGLAPTVNREVARNMAAHRSAQSADLLHSLAVFYWAASALIALLVFFLAPFVADFWLNSTNLQGITVQHTVMLMGVVIACRWPISIYQGAVIGAQKLTVSSAINIVMVSLGSFGAIAILAFVSPTIQAYFIWQALVGLLHSLVVRQAAWRIVGGGSTAKFSLDVLRPVWRFSAGIGAVAITGAILMQLDKIILSRMLSLEDFARYTLASLLASSLLILLTPVFNTIFPRMSGLVAMGDMDGLLHLYRRGTRLLSTALFPLAAILYFFSQDIVLLWTGDSELAASAAPIVSCLAVGFAINGVMIFPYALQLAHGNHKIPLTITTLLIFIQVPVAIALVSYLGALGGALSWVFLNVFYLFFGTWLTHRHFLVGMGARWLLRDIMLPLVVSLFAVYILLMVVMGLNISDYLHFN